MNSLFMLTQAVDVAEKSGIGSAMNNNMPISERISTGFMVMLLGMSIVFLVLLLIYGVLSLSQFFFVSASNKEKAKPAPVNEAPVVVNTPAVQNDGELVAVITAAVSCVMGQPASSFKVVSFKKINQNSAWNKNV